MNALTAQNVLLSLVLGTFLGAIGQGARVVVGIKKTFDEANAQNAPFASLFDARQLVVSLIIGGIAGALASLNLITDVANLSSQTIIGLIGAGYAGADFIEGFMRNEAISGKNNASTTQTATNGNQTTGVSADDLGKLVPAVKPSDQVA
jgi:uncharacterized membrane protein YeaQ/YmgE (transglycosylase-associated protein family)